MTAIVITTINDVSSVTEFDKIASDYNDVELYVIGDEKTPDLKVINGNYYSIESQQKLGFDVSQFPKSCYTRKNIGYALAYKDCHQYIINADDDNYPIGNDYIDNMLECFNSKPRYYLNSSNQYCNYLPFFCNSETNPHVWPRGIPPSASYGSNLDYSGRSLGDEIGVVAALWNESPDFDAIGHILYDYINFKFEENITIRNFQKNKFSPYNSQNTAFIRKLLPLQFLPPNVGRACDIWASYLSQHVMKQYGYSICFASPTVVQRRNVHSYNNDVVDEFECITKVDLFVSALNGVYSRRVTDESMIDMYHRCCEAVACIMPVHFMKNVDKWLRLIDSFNA
jgi:hypothetical protein